MEEIYNGFCPEPDKFGRAGYCTGFADIKQRREIAVLCRNASDPCFESLCGFPGQKLDQLYDFLVVHYVCTAEFSIFGCHL